MTSSHLSAPVRTKSWNFWLLKLVSAITLKVEDITKGDFSHDPIKRGFGNIYFYGMMLADFPQCFLNFHIYINKYPNVKPIITPKNILIGTYFREQNVTFLDFSKNAL